MDESVITQILGISLIAVVSLLVLMIIIYVVIKIRMDNKSKTNKEEQIEVSDDSEDKNKKKKKEVETTNAIYNKQSIFDFMEFDDIQDNMIVQKESKKYVMVIECQGINYDLMSQMEKIAVEEGFQQFLNTLRHPIQIYIQTRTINLEENINRYKERIKDLEQKYNRAVYEYRRMQESNAYSQEEIRRYYYEVTKQKNLLDYGRDIVANTENMSLNKNILNKKYYVVISYFVEEGNLEKYDKNEIRNIAFSELYTKAQALVRALSACSVSGKILNSRELVELLYMAYNRDDAELYGLDTVLNNQYDVLYSTSQDVFEKKLRYLDREIQDRAINKANETVDKVKSRAQQLADDKEQNLDELVNNLAQLIIKENRQYIGADVAEQAVNEIEKEKEEGQDVGQKENGTSKRGRKKKIEQ